MIDWKELQPSFGGYDFAAFDKMARSALSRGKAMNLCVVTGSGRAPKWLYEHGVTKVHVNGKKVPGSDGTWPCYSDNAYKKFFHDMHAALKGHVEKTYKDDLHKFAGIDLEFGSTGDVTPWHGTPDKCKFSRDEWLQYWADETVQMAKTYTDWLSDPKRSFYLVTRGTEKMPEHMRSPMLQAIPRSHWVERDHLYCKTYGENFEKTSVTMKDTTYALTHTEKDGYYVLSDCAQDVGLPNDCKKDIVVTIWQTMMYMLMWGQDRVQTMYLEGVKGNARGDQLWKFFNRYAGHRATNGKSYEGAWASLKVGLDAADKERFPEAEFGNGCDGIIAKHKAMGARQEDKSIDPGSIMNGRTRHGMNDCGWDILPGNYYMFLEQIDADTTSLGMWRVGDFTSGKPGQFFGRFARTFSSSKGMNDMFFAVTGDVFAETKAETLNMRIVYYDQGSGGFSVQYGSGCKDEQKFTKHNSGLWKEARLQIPTTGLAKACQRSADFILHNTDNEDDAFAFVEVSARDLIPLITTESNDLTSVLV